MPKVGDRAPSAEIRARWTYSEFGGTQRFLHTYPNADAVIVKQAEAGTPFDALSLAEKSALETVHSTDRTGLWHLLQQIPTYECVSWSKGAICQCYVVPALDPQGRAVSVPIIAYIASPRNNDPADARTSADRVPLGTPFAQAEPICVIPIQVNGRGVPMILDGTGRTVLFIRSDDLLAEILVWVPVGVWSP